MTIRVGILGCGKNAGSQAQALRQSDGAHLLVCADLDRPREESFSAEYRVPYAVSSLEQVIDLGVDAVCICTPHPLHEEALLTAAQADVHVLCEKPITVHNSREPPGDG